MCVMMAAMAHVSNEIKNVCVCVCVCVCVVCVHMLCPVLRPVSECGLEYADAALRRCNTESCMLHGSVAMLQHSSDKACCSSVAA